MGLTPEDHQGEHNMPPDDENREDGGGLPPIPQGGQVPWQHMQPLQPPLQPPRQQPPQSPYYGYPPLPSSPSNSQISRLSYVDPLDPAPTPVPTLPPVSNELVKYIDDDEVAQYRDKLKFGISNGRNSAKEDPYTSQGNLVMRKVRSFLNLGLIRPRMPVSIK